MKIHFPNITGSAASLNGFTGSLLGTASYAITASYALNGGSGGSGGDFVTSSWTGSSSSQFSGTASFAITASHALNGGGSTFNSTSSVIGDGTNTVFNINHGFNTRNLHITVYDSTSGDIVYPDLKHVNANTSSVTFANAPKINFPYIVYISQ